MKVWVLSFENYMGDYFIELYSTEEKAMQSFDKCIAEHHNEDEFEITDNVISWFDPSINEFSTYISLDEQEVF